MDNRLARLRQIASEIRSAPDSFKGFGGGATKGMMQTVAALVQEAIALGAFAGPDHDRLRSLVRLQELRYPDWLDGIFMEAATCLAHDVYVEHGPGGCVPHVCGPIADAIETQTEQMKDARSGSADESRSDDPSQVLSPGQLADRLGILSGDTRTREALRKRLEAWRKANLDGGWKEVADPKPREPKYLYPLGTVWPLIEDLKPSR